jgi:hypothetical protein
MSHATLVPSLPPGPAPRTGVRLAVALALAAWLAGVALLGAAHAFDTPPGRPPFPIALGVLSPVAVFFVALGASRPFRDWVLALDPRVTAVLQAWRFGGFAFVALYAHDVLPGHFALPAGLGDMAIAAAAPWILVRLLRDPAFAGSRAYLAWNVLGLVDLVVAVIEGGLGAALATGAAGEITTAPMAHLPLLLIPAWFVPLYMMLHATALMQVRRMRASA